MRSLRISAFLFLTLISVQLQSHQLYAQSRQVEKFMGSWIGMLKLPNGQSIHIGFDFRPSSDTRKHGDIEGTWSSPDQGGYTGNLDTVTTAKDSISTFIRLLHGSFSGELSSDRNAIHGFLVQGMMPFPLTLHKANIYFGTLTDSIGTLRVAFKVADGNSLGKIGVFESLDEAETARPLDSIAENEDDARSVRYRVASIDAVFLGSRTPDGQKIVGTWTQHGEPSTLTLVKVTELPSTSRPQDPTGPVPYVEEEVSYPNPQAGITIAGTLTHPQGKGPFPVALMITGSGQQDRDETIMGHHPFRVIADYLTRRGIAVLRVDDRGIGGTGGRFDTSTTLDFASDTRAGVQYLRTRSDINTKKIGLIGHSEGGIIAPMVASEDKGIAFIVLMAGPGIPSRKLMDWQRRMLLEGAHKSNNSRELITYFGAADSLVSLMNSSNDPKLTHEFDSVVQLLVELQTGADTSSTGRALVKQYTAAQERALLSPWHKYFIAYDPKPVLMKVKCPVLAIDGSLDMQVEPKEDLEGIRTALKMGGNTNVTIKELPGLNHLFQTAKTGRVDEYARINETFAPAALEVMGAWIETVTKK